MLKKYISLSGGVESTTMCILYGKGATAIWCDTGAEHEKMYERFDLLEAKLKQIHNGDFEIIRIKPTAKIKGKIVDNLLDAVIQQEFMPAPRMRYCTRQFKIEPIDNFLSTKGECELMIGLNADEEATREGNFMKCKNVKYTYPLIEADINRAMCEDILNIHGLHPNFPVYMQRGGCVMCFFKSEAEYKAMYYLNRPEFDRMVKFEEDYQGRKKHFYAIMSSGKSLKQLANQLENELFQEELLTQYINQSSNKKACGAFCHR